MIALSHSKPAEARTKHFGALVEDVYQFVGVVRRRWRVVAVANLVFLTLATFYLARTRAVYRASARLLVVQQEGRPVGVSGGSDPLGHLPSHVDTLSTHLMIIRSPIIVGRALERSRSAPPPMDRVIDRLRVQQAAGGARVLDLEYHADTEAEALSLLEGIIASYDQFLKDNYQNDINEVISLFAKARDGLSKELKELERSYLEFRKQNPGVTAVGEGRSPLLRRLDQWDQAVSVATARAVQLRAQLELVKKLSREGAGPGDIVAALNQLAAAGGDATGPAAPASFDPEDGSEPRSLKDPGATYELVARELSGVEFQRRSAERLLDHVRSQGSAMSRERPADVNERREAFHAEPEVAERIKALQRARVRHNDALRMVRNASDPSVLSSRSQVKRLEREIEELWQVRKDGLHGAGDDDLIRRSSAEILVLRAREAWLRERAEALRTEELRRLSQERVGLVQKHGAGHPEVAAVEARVAALHVGTDPEGLQGRGPVDLMIASLERSLAGVEAMRAEYQKRLDGTATANHEAELNRLAEANLRYDLERQRTLFDSVAAQLKQAQLASDYGSVTAQTIEPPRVTPIRPRVSLVILLVLALGTGCGVGAAWFVEFLDARVRTISEVRAVVDFPIMTLVPRVVLGEFPGVVHCGLLCHQVPRSLPAELYKSARTFLESVRRERLAQVLLISSANPGDGKSTTASNLAICQANAGRRTLLIDADLRRPTIHMIYNLDRGSGLGQILTGERTINSVIQPTGIPGLDVITSGPDVPNPAELLSSPHLAACLAEARERYDCILIDASPLLAVTDPCIISAVVDGFILVVRVGEVRRPELERTMDILANLGTPALGAILNDVTREEMGFGERFSHKTLYGLNYGYNNDPTGERRTTPAPPASLMGIASKTGESNGKSRNEAGVGPRAAT